MSYRFKNYYLKQRLNIGSFFLLTMDKKTVLLELPCEMIEKIDRLNQTGDRSAYVTELLEKQLQEQTLHGTDATTKMKEPQKLTGEIDLSNDEGESLGRFNVNTLEGFQELARMIQEVSEDPVVRVRARQWL
jgi:hypothetical protein